MDKNIKINHPKQTDHPKVIRIFAAYGHSKGDVGLVKGVMIPQKGKEIEGKTMTDKGDPHWIIWFHLPVAPRDMEYTLVVTDEAKTIRREVDHITILRDNRDIQIAHPGDGDTVCPDFAAYGTATVIVDSVTLTPMRKPQQQGGTPPKAAKFWQDPDGNWVRAFNGVAESGPKYFLEAKGDGSEDHKKDITVSKTDCES